MDKLNIWAVCRRAFLSKMSTSRHCPGWDEYARHIEHYLSQHGIKTTREEIDIGDFVPTETDDAGEAEGL